jgi:predicted Rossmann fold nucleotide-binding protein DprA/Smf involved in DNA uptake
MKYAVIGSRSVTDYELVEKILLTHIKPNDIIVSGGATGADSLGAKFAHKHCKNLPTIFKPNWKKYGKSAGYKRNVLIINECDSVIAFHDGKSKGTLHSIKLAKKQCKTIHLYLVQDECDWIE